MSPDHHATPVRALGREDFARLVAAIAEMVSVPLLLDGVQARKYLGLSKSGWHRAKSAGLLPDAVHVEGSGDRFRRADLDALVERLKPRRTRRNG